MLYNNTAWLQIKQACLIGKLSSLQCVVTCMNNDTHYVVDSIILYSHTKEKVPTVQIR